jgi:hypothetical protein
MDFAPFAIGLVRQLFANLGQMVLTVGIWDVGQKFGAFLHPMTAPAQEIPGGAHFSWVAIRLGEHPAA